MSIKGVECRRVEGASQTSNHWLRHTAGSGDAVNHRAFGWETIVPLTPDWFEENCRQLRALSVLMAIILIVGIVVVTAFSRPAKDTSPRPALSESQSTSDGLAPKPKTSQTKFPIGSPANGKNWEYTVNHLKSEQLIENSFNNVVAESGKKFLIVNMTFKNKTSKVVHVDPGLFEFKVHTPKGTFKECKNRDILEVAEDHYGHIGDVGPWQSVVGTVIFEVPDMTSGAALEIGCDNLTCDLASE